MDKIKGFSIELSLDSLQVDSGLKNLKRSMSNINSELKNNMSQFKYSEKSVEKYGVQLDGLNKKYEAQKTVVAAAKKEYEDLASQYDENSDKVQRAARNYNNEMAQLNNLGHHIDNVTQEMQSFAREQQIQESSWYKTGDALQNFGGKLGDVSQKALEVGGTLTKRITLPVAGVTTAIGGMVAAFGWGRLTGLDTAQAQLKGLGYNTEEVGRISDQVTNAIEGGMTTMAEGTAIAAGAMAAGVKEGKDLERYIKLVGDAAVGANRPVEDMAQIFNRVQGQGKLMTQELNMIEQGMPGFSNAMAEELGVSQEAFREMVTNGEIDSKQFLDVMDDFAGGMAEAYADSWQGMLANTKAYIGIIGENLLGGVFEKSKESIAEFVEMLQSDAVQKWAQEAGEKLGSAFSNIVDKIKGVVHWYMDLSTGQKKFIAGIGGFIVALGPLLTGLGIFGGFLSSISKGLGSFFKFLAPILTPLKGVASAAGGAGKSVGLLSRAFTFLTGPVGIAIGIITTLATGFTIAYKKSETFREFVHKLGDKIKEIFLGIVDWIKPGFDAVMGFFNGIKNKVTGFANEEGPQLIEAFQNIWEFVSPILEWIADKVRWAFDTVINPIINVVMKAVELVIKTVWGNIKGIITGALDVIMGAIKVFSGIFTGDTEKMWEGVKQIFSGAIKVIWNWIQLQFIGRIVKGVSGLAKTFWGHIKNLWSWVKETFKNSISSVYNGVKNSFVGRIVKSIIGFSKNFLQRIKVMWQQTKDRFKYNIENIRESIANSFVGRMLKSVGELKTKFIGVAKDMWGGVKKQFNNIVTGAKNLPGRIGKGIKGAKSKATSGMKNVGNSLIKWAGKPFNKVVDGVNWVTGKLGVKKKIGKWDYPQYAKGTKGAHGGGPALLGDGIGSNAGSELVSTPKGSFLSAAKPTLYPDLPKGSHVFSATDTRNLFSNIPKYATGTDSASGFLKRGSDATGGNIKKKPWTERVWDYVKKPKKLLDIALDKMGAKLPKNTAMFKNMLKGGFNTVKDAALSKVKGTFKEQEHNNPNLMVGGKPSFGFPITSHFGYRTHPITGQRKLHSGTDFGAPAGTPIPSQTAGTVSFAGRSGGYGNLVKVKNGIWEMYYAHMSKILTSVGRKVSKGTKLGLVGSTGQSTAPHLHYEVRKNGTPLDPMKVAPAGAGSGVQRWTSTAKKALRMTGSYSAGNLEKLLFQMKTESNGNPRAINNWDINAKRGTPSKGLMQVIDPTFQAYKMSGYNNIWNPLDNMLASIRYAKSRYGSLARAYRGTGYATGGLINSEHMAMLGEEGQEMVIPLNKSRRGDAMKLLALTSRMLGADGSDSKRPSSLPNVGNNENDEQVELLKEQNRLLKAILRKDDDATLDGKSIKKNIDHRLAMGMR